MKGDPELGLLYGVARTMHLPPDVVRGMTYEDVVGIAVHAQLEAEEMEKKHPSGGQQPGQKTTRLKKR